MREVANLAGGCLAWKGCKSWLREVARERGRVREEEGGREGTSLLAHISFIVYTTENRVFQLKMTGFAIA